MEANGQEAPVTNYQDLLSNLVAQNQVISVAMMA